MSTMTRPARDQQRAASSNGWVRFAPLVSYVLAGVMFALRLRRMWPIYWAACELLAVVLAEWFHVGWATVALVAALVVTGAGVWRARSLPVRLYRLVVVGTFALFAVGAVAVGPGALTRHPTTFVFGSVLAAFLLGWPWWHYLRGQKALRKAAPIVQPAEYWAQRWRDEVVAEGVCVGTRLSDPHYPRPGVLEATVTLKAGARPREILNKGVEVEVCLDLNLGSVGWRQTEKAARVQLIVVERSHIHDGVPWKGPTYDNGICELITFADGTPGHWTFYAPGVGTSNGLIVGSTRSGKSRAGAVLIENLLEGEWMVAVGDAQGGQSLPAWRNTVEFHPGVDAVDALIFCLEAEVARRSELLAEVGVEMFDDPRAAHLGLRKLAAVIDECHLSLRQEKRRLIQAAENVASLDGKTGVSVIFLTQLPQLASLGGSQRLRDALVAGNALILRLSNRGSGTTILPDDFVGDPFAIPKRVRGKITAGMGYLRDAEQLGMLGRVPALDETAAASRRVLEPVEWLVPPVDLSAVAAGAGGATSAAAAAGVEGFRSIFNLGGNAAASPQVAPRPASAQAWVVACLERAPMSAQALLSRPDCKVKQAQLYDVLKALVASGRINRPAEKGGPYTVA